MNNELLTQADYAILQSADIESGGEIADLLNRNGCPNWTVCPLCHCDDFIHSSDCPLDEQ